MAEVTDMIDLRSDTVTRPTAQMLAAMMAAPVGDDVWGDDPTVIALESEAAALLGKEAGLFVTSGTQSNLCALMTHCGRGDEYIAGENAHTYKYEAGGAAVLGSIQPQTVRVRPDGSLDLDHVRSVVKPDDPHFARSKLLCLENTHDGKVQTVAQMHEAGEVARSLGLALHLDGARLWNAAAALGVTPAELAEPFDSVSVCLSKGLGAPVGSVLVGSRAFIRQAHRWRKMLGGAMRQAGYLAAAGRYALENHRTRLVDDHANAAQLGALLAQIDGVTVHAVNTNMAFASFPVENDELFTKEMEARGVLMAVHGGHCRMVTHLDVSAADIPVVAQAVAATL